MGQYQDGLLNLKGSVLELAQRNSQVSIPFCVSSGGYGCGRSRNLVESAGLGWR